MKKLSITIALFTASVANANCSIQQMEEAVKSKIKSELLTAAKQNSDFEAYERIQEELEFSGYNYNSKTKTFKVVAGYNPVEFSEDHEISGTMNSQWYVNRLEQQDQAPLAGVSYAVTALDACQYELSTNQKTVRFLGSKADQPNWLGFSSIKPYRVKALENFRVQAR